MKLALIKLARRLIPRKRKSWDDVSSWMLVVLGLVSTTEAGYYGYVLQRFAPDFLKIVDTHTLASWLNVTFLACVGILSVIGLQFFFWTVAATGSVALLQKRLFGT